MKFDFDLEYNKGFPDLFINYATYPVWWWPLQHMICTWQFLDPLCSSRHNLSSSINSWSSRGFIQSVDGFYLFCWTWNVIDMIDIL